LIQKLIHLLGGYVLQLRGKPIGYLYHVIEDRKSTIGGLYVTAAHRNHRNEDLLLDASLTELFKTWGVRRVQAQLMLLDDPMTRRYPRQEWLQAHQREFMETSLEAVQSLDPVTPRYPVFFEPWTPASMDESAVLLARSYQGHVDGTINDLYRTPSGARTFLGNIVQYPGCGSFYPSASFCARDATTRRMVGMLLASVVGQDIGHVTQVCVGKEARNSRLGYELMRRSMAAMAEQGFDRVSLTVTSANPAIELYRSMGFVTRSLFAALVWDGF
jgi:ribosomal protein S18 acetylase RimI-like enzyme